MRKSILLLAAVAGCFAACQNTSTEQKIDSLATPPDTSKASGQACYAYIKNRDTVSLTFTTAGHEIAGKLSYNLFEKDKNSGTVSGLIKGDTIIADYSATGEGMTYVAQVAFLKKGDQLLEGYGPSEEKNGKRVFTDLSALKFGQAIVLSATTCK
jgi:hypothetical protein